MHVYDHHVNSVLSNDIIRSRLSFLYQTVKIHLFIRGGFWTRKGTYLSFILRYWARELFRAVTTSFNAFRFDWCCCQIWNSKTTCTWRSMLETLSTITSEIINHILWLSREPAIFFSAYQCYVSFFLFSMFLTCWINCSKNNSQLAWIQFVLWWTEHVIKRSQSRSWN